MGSARHCACRSLTFNMEHPAAGERRNAPPPRSALHQAPAGADRLRDHGKSARSASHDGTLPGQENAAPGAWHQDTRSRPRCEQGPYRRQPSRARYADPRQCVPRGIPTGGWSRRRSWRYRAAPSDGDHQRVPECAKSRPQGRPGCAVHPMRQPNRARRRLRNPAPLDSRLVFPTRNRSQCCIR